jgi:hypothetical protein
MPDSITTSSANTPRKPTATAAMGSSPEIEPCRWTTACHMTTRRAEAQGDHVAKAAHAESTIA